MATTTKHNVLTFNEFNESMSTDKCIGAMWNSFSNDESASFFNRKSMMVVCTFLTASCNGVSPMLFCALISEKIEKIKKKIRKNQNKRI